MRRPARVLLGALATALVAGALLLSALREIDTTRRIPAMLGAFAAYGTLGFLGNLLLAVPLLRRAGPRARSWLVGGTAVAVLGLVVQVVWNAPLFTGDGASGRHAGLTVMQANLQFGSADPATVVRIAKASGAQVVVLEEVTFGEYPRLKAAGLLRRYPHVAGLADYSAAGTFVFSQYPLRDVKRVAISNGGVEASVRAPRPFELLAVHPSQPRNDAQAWHRDLELTRSLARAAVRRGPTLVVGDFNATRDYPAFRAILGVGLADAAEQAGSGWQPTWPESLPISGPGGTSHGTWLRPVIAIDHVLASSQFAAVSTETHPMPGSDHRALIAHLST